MSKAKTSPKHDLASAERQSRDCISWSAWKFRRVFGAALCASYTGKEARPHLNAVHVKRENSTVTVSATDGHWAFRWREVEGMTDEDGEPIDRTPFSCLIPRRVLESFLAATKKPVELEKVQLSTRDDVGFSLRTIFDVISHDFTQVPEEFPAVDKVIPVIVNPTCTSIGIGANMTAIVGRSFGIATGDSNVMIFWQLSGDALSPLVCTCPTQEELIAVVMPRRVDNANAVPDKPVADNGIAAAE